MNLILNVFLSNIKYLFYINELIFYLECFLYFNVDSIECQGYSIQSI